MTKSATLPTVKVILYKQKTYANGEHPLMLQSIQDRKVKRVSLGLTCSPDLWDFKKGEPKKKHPDFLRLQSIIAAKLEEYRSTMIELLDEGRDFTPETLVQRIEKVVKRSTVFEFFELVIERMNTSNRVGNAQVYRETYNSFKLYRKDADLLFSDVNYTELTNYETFLRSRSVKDSTLSVRFRTIRALYRMAIAEGIVKEYHYPFDKFKISSKRFNLETKRTAITKEEVYLIRDLDTGDNQQLTLAKHYFLFSYYGAGINFVDFCKLKPENLAENRIFYKRSKTHANIDFKLLEINKQIIDYWKEQTTGTGYLFPILDESKHKTATQIDNRIKKVNGQVNRALKEIAVKCGIESHLSSGVARHTFATSLKRQDVNTAIIQDLMKHKTQAITQTYLASFGDDVKDAAMDVL